MWGFVDSTRYFMSAGQPIVVLFEASMIVAPDEKAALLVRPGGGKSTILRMLAGLERPDDGIVLRDEGGWPLGYAGAFHPNMTAADNVRNLAQLAGVDALQLSAFCLDFSELGPLYYEPVKLYSSSMKARLGMAASLGIPARTYLADDKLATGDEQFRRKCLEAVSDKLRTCGLIFVGSNPRAVKDVCDSYFVVTGGKIVRADGYDDAVRMFDVSSQDGADGSAEADLPTFDLA